MYYYVVLLQMTLYGPDYLCGCFVKLFHDVEPTNEIIFKENQYLISQELQEYSRLLFCRLYIITTPSNIQDCLTDYVGTVKHFNLLYSEIQNKN